MPRVVVIPVSGYINRLQAITSAALLAEDLGADFHICWLPQAVAPVPIESVLADGTCIAYAVDAAEVRSSTGIDPDHVPRYLGRSGDVITLAGHDRGEQVFMRGLRGALEEGPVDAIVIRAGGRFFLPGPGIDEETFRGRRHAFYRQEILASAIEAEAAHQTTAHTPYLGLHLRYTDRAHQAPTGRTIARALSDLAEGTGIHRVFIASDTAAMRDTWRTRIARLGLEPWAAEHAHWDRSVAGSEFAALVDWRILGGAAALVYFAESTFAVEAAVASPGFAASVALPPSPLRSLGVRAADLTRAAVTYPKRRGWLPSA